MGSTLQALVKAILKSLRSVCSQKDGHFNTELFEKVVHVFYAFFYLTEYFVLEYPS
jgi:hypothetical protein